MEGVVSIGFKINLLCRVQSRHGGRLGQARLVDALIRDRGSIQTIDGIPDDIKALYKTAWEIDQRDLADMAADRGAYICQSQSFNVHVDRNNTNLDPIELRLASYHMYAWQKGLKTGMYYLRCVNSHVKCVYYNSQWQARLASRAPLVLIATIRFFSFLNSTC